MSNYKLYGDTLIENDETLHTFAVSLISNIQREGVDDEAYVELIRESLMDDISRTDIDYEELLHKYRNDIGHVLYEMDNDGMEIPQISFFSVGAKVFFNSLVMAYIELVIVPNLEQE